MNKKKLGGRQPGRPPLPPELKKPERRRLTLDLPPDLYEYIKSLEPGSAEKILRDAQTNSLIV